MRATKEAERNVWQELDAAMQSMGPDARQEMLRALAQRRNEIMHAADPLSQEDVSTVLAHNIAEQREYLKKAAGKVDTTKKSGKTAA